MRRARSTSVVAVVASTVVLLQPASAQAVDTLPGDSLVATGVFTPSGPPVAPPRRVAAGDACVVDVQQSYDVEGTLVGTFEIDFRILVHGPCGSAPGSFDEEWIALGRFAGSIQGRRVSSSFTYTAAVRNAGEIQGTMELGPEIAGELQVVGRFQTGQVTYAGWVRR